MAEALIKYNHNTIWDLLSEVKDPEIPVLSIAELGILRKVSINGPKVTVHITPTYSGCPAMKTIENEIEKKLRINGIQHFEVVKDFSETWTTDWMSGDAKQKLKEYGIAPPGETNPNATLSDTLQTPDKVIACPYCESGNTELQSEFGSTACKAQYYCHDCQEPFEHFKCI